MNHRITHNIAECFAALLASAFIFHSGVWAQFDVTPPVLVDFSFTPTSVDVTNGPANVTITMHITDDNWFHHANVVLLSPSGNKSMSYGIDTSSLVAGTPIDGYYRYSATIAQYPEPGTWTVQGVTLVDLAPNTIEYSTGTLQSMGLPIQLTVVSVWDASPPLLAGFSFAPAGVDVTNGPASITVTMHITDMLSGFSHANVVFVSPSSANSIVNGIDASFLESGGPTDGIYQYDLNFAQYSEAGTWIVQRITLSDIVNNTIEYSALDLQAMSFSTQLAVVSVQDVYPPVLADFSFTPSSVNTTTATANINFSMHIIDGSGVASGVLTFSSPSGIRSVTWGLSKDSVSGTQTDGIYGSTLQIPAYTEPGTWTVQNISLADNVNNRIDYTTDKLQSMGFQTELTVISLLDANHPMLSGLSITPTSVDPSSVAKTVNITMNITDDISGLGSVFLVFSRPDTTGAVVPFTYFGSLISGTSRDGVYSSILEISQNSIPATWTLLSISLADNASNSISYSTEDLESMGFPTQITVGSGAGTIHGYTKVDGLGLAAVTVELLVAGGEPLPNFPFMSTDAAGYYEFTNVPSPRNFQIMIVEPLGYSVSQNPQFVSLVASGVVFREFELTKTVVSNKARSASYWKSQFDVYVTKRGKAVESRDQLILPPSELRQSVS